MAWRVSLAPGQQATTFYLDTRMLRDMSDNNDDHPIDINGFVKLQQGRFIDLDLACIVKAHHAGRSDTWQYAIASRRLRAGQLNYIDHPNVGVLAMITDLN